jgi:hypothetical protein
VALLLMRLGGERWATGDEPGCLAAFEEAVRILPAEPARVLAEYAQSLMLAAPLRDAVGRAEEALVVARTVGAGRGGPRPRHPGNLHPRHRVPRRGASDRC